MYSPTTRIDPSLVKLAVQQHPAGLVLDEAAFATPCVNRFAAARLEQERA